MEGIGNGDISLVDDSLRGSTFILLEPALWSGN
jgi:hypothetical protein